jgi:hypothetical protein
MTHNLHPLNNTLPIMDNLKSSIINYDLILSFTFELVCIRNNLQSSIINSKINIYINIYTNINNK